LRGTEVGRGLADCEPAPRVAVHAQRRLDLRADKAAQLVTGLVREERELHATSVDANSGCVRAVALRSRSMFSHMPYVSSTTCWNRSATCASLPPFASATSASTCL